MKKVVYDKKERAELLADLCEAKKQLQTVKLRQNRSAAEVKKLRTLRTKVARIATVLSQRRAVAKQGKIVDDASMRLSPKKEVAT